MDQLKEGLLTLGFLNELKKNPSLWEPYFLHINDPLTTGTTHCRKLSNYIEKLCITIEKLKHIFTVNFCVEGSLTRPKEEQAYIHVYFIDLLDEFEGMCNCSN